MSARQRGFALVDLAIATAVSGAVLGGIVSLSSARLIADQEQTTRVAIAEARQALIAYSQIHRRLPCPANPRLPATNPRAGQEGVRRGGSCEFGYFGALPWSTLGLSQLDAWGSRLTYRVASDFADGADECGAQPQSDAVDCLRLAQSPSGHSATSQSLVVKEDRGASSSSPETIAHGLAAVIVSHGPNGLLGFPTSGQQRIEAGTGFGRYESNNADPRAVTFYTSPVDRRVATCQAAGIHTGCAHDDLLGWLSRAEITASMLKAGHQ